MIFIKKLPKIYQNTIDKPIHNNKKTYYIKNNTSKNESILEQDSMSIEQIGSIIDEIFNGVGYPFNIPVVIKTNNKIYETNLVTRTNGYLLTLDYDKIRLEDIVSIQIKNP